jgi:hypothetical protein
MEFGYMLQRLWHLRLLVALGVLVAALAAINAGYRVDLDPLSVEQRGGTQGAARMVLYVDSPRPSLVTSADDYETLTSRAQILAHFIDSGEVRRRVARRLDVPVEAIAVEGPFSDAPGSQNVQPAAQQRANALLGRGAELDVFVDTEANVPTITLFLQAPTGERAERLGNAVAESLQAYVRALTEGARSGELERARDEALALEADRDRNLSAAEERRQRRALLDRGTTIVAVGDPIGDNVRDQTGMVVVVLVFAGVIVAWCVALLLLSGLVRTVRRR